MTQLRLYPPPAANRRPLPEALRREVLERVVDLLVAVIAVSLEEERTREGQNRLYRPPRRSRATPPRPSHPIPRRVRPELQTPPPHHPLPCPSNRPRASCVSSRAHELDAAAQASLPHRHRTLWRVWRHIACHRVHRDSRGHRENPRPSRRAQHRLQRLPPRTAAACVRSPTPGLPIPDAVLTAPAGAPQPRCASIPVPLRPHRLPDMLS